MDNHSRDDVSGFVYPDFDPYDDFGDDDGAAVGSSAEPEPTSEPEPAPGVEPVRAEQPTPSAKRRLKLWQQLLLDVAVTGLALVVFAYFHHVRKIVVEPPPPPSSSDASFTSSRIDFIADEPDGFSVSDADPVDDSPFASMFTDKIVRTDSRYSSPNVCVSMTDAWYCENGRQLSEYHVADIYVRDISCFRTLFANDTCGRGIAEDAVDAAARTDAICLINGDYYGTSIENQIIRNGSLYGRRPKGRDVCVLYTNGTMTTYSSTEFDADKALSDGAWQMWSFGPSLLDADGKALRSFNSSVKGNNPRSIVGFYEPGHYCLIAVDGRRSDSAGLTLAQSASLCESMGLVCAYNLDGGQTTVMTFGTETANVPYRNGRPCSDFIYVCEPEHPSEVQ